MMPADSGDVGGDGRRDFLKKAVALPAALAAARRAGRASPAKPRKAKLRPLKPSAPSTSLRMEMTPTLARPSIPGGPCRVLSGRRG